ncbi:MAG: hypothetical protein H7328_07740 [Bdellovibrio sp.]|nr:hypothetical protein [Bdellovibrio sp.]
MSIEIKILEEMIENIESEAPQFLTRSYLDDAEDLIMTALLKDLRNNRELVESYLETIEIARELSPLPSYELSIN